MKKLRVKHRPAGYRGWLDTYTIATPNYRAIWMIVGGIFIAGMVTALMVMVFATPSPSPDIKRLKEDVQATPTPTFTTTQMIFIVSTAQPTATPTASATPTGTTAIDVLATISAMQTHAAQPTAQPPTPDILATIVALETQRQRDVTPQIIATSTPASPQAIVRVDAAIIRNGPGVDFRAMQTATFGERFDVVSQAYGWVQISGVFGTGWIAGWLVQIEGQQ
jgi:hypothetical protein